MLRYADLELDEHAHVVRRNGEPVRLSPTEFDLLHYLLLNAERVVSKSQILDRVWDYQAGGDGRIVESYISYLRRKIDVHDPPLIHTIRGVGYTLRAAPAGRR
ncbi:MAG TPA: winged helix-turn-helix domain-containing protein [Actinopolymorphaceae bacterium]|jgi:two-component system OmpR family response regulator